MPNVSISAETQERLLAEAELSVKKENTEMFETPNVSLNIKAVEEIKPMDRNGVEEGQEGFEAPPPPKPKQKRKLTEKQLDALARGRETSMKNRVAKSKEKKVVKAEQSVLDTPKAVVPKAEKFVYQEPTDIPQPQHPHYNQPPIDYEKIISGVANMYQQQQQDKIDRNNHETKVNNDVAMFEAQIREDERVKLMTEFDNREKQKVKDKALKTTQNIYNRNPTPSGGNPFAYAFNMNSRNQNTRY